MNKIYKLYNQIKHYEWGSAHLLPQFLGIENRNGIPYAEMWMGTNSGAPSKISMSPDFLDDKKEDLFKLSGDIPFLLKIIAVEKPLSIQAHPDKEQAAQGFRREEELKLHLKSPSRNYKDPNHKPEILCALSPFTLMAGFRKPDEIHRSLEEFIKVIPQLKELFSPMFRALKTDMLEVFFRILFYFSKLELEYITKLVNEVKISDTGGVTVQQWELMKNFAVLYPDEIAILSPLYLNYFTLQPGQAVFIPAGVLHSYISGFGVELMANSDNVLRCGLTPKYIDVPELMNILNFTSFMPPVITPGSSSWFCYQTPCDEFLLALMRAHGSEEIFPEKGPAVCVVTEGELLADGLIFKKGESFFIPQDAHSLSFAGNYSLFAAVTPLR
jgi:mannose-6-phosphate isomerase